MMVRGNIKNVSGMFPYFDLTGSGVEPVLDYGGKSYSVYRGDTVIARYKTSAGLGFALKEFEKALHMGLPFFIFKEEVTVKLK